MVSQEYHDLYVTAFIGIWASFETGIENVARDYILNDRNVASNVLSQFKKVQLNMDDWPWSPQESLFLAKKLDMQAKRVVKDGGRNFSDRLIKTFEWLNIPLKLSEEEKMY